MIFRLILVLIFLSSPIWARFKPMPFEDFVHLPAAEQEKFIIKFMELIVELDQQTKKDPKAVVHTPAWDHLRHYFIHNLKLPSPFGDAWAQNSNPSNKPKVTPSQWMGWAETFLRQSDPSKTDCIFGGWMSSARNIQSGNYKVICSHPRSLDPTSSEKGFYDQIVQGNCPSSPNNPMIACNPLVFGFEEWTTSPPKVFCVSSANWAPNSSLQCMRKATDPTTNELNHNLRNLRHLLQATSTYNLVQNYILDVCLCKPHQMYIQQRYSDYMVHHRTCYGLVKMIGSSLPGCYKDKFEHFKEIIDFKDSGLKGFEIDLRYKEIISRLGSDGTIAKICNRNPGPGPEPEPEPGPGPEPNKPAVNPPVGPVAPGAQVININGGTVTFKNYYNLNPNGQNPNWSENKKPQFDLNDPDDPDDPNNPWNEDDPVDDFWDFENRERDNKSSEPDEPDSVSNNDQNTNIKDTPNNPVKDTNNTSLPNLPGYKYTVPGAP